MNRLVTSMSQFKVYQDYSSDATLVSNAFIDYYMKDANDAQIKIYLYLLKVLSLHMGCSVSDLADQFNYTEKDVIRALKYWERKGLIALEFDDARNLSGVRLLDIIERSSDTVSLAPVVPIPKVVRHAVNEEHKAAAPTVENQYTKPAYCAEDVLSFKNNESTSELLFVVEQYLGKPLTASEIKTLMFFSDSLEFSNELIDYLFEYCLSKGKKDFRYIERVAIGWKEEGITTPKMAAKAAKKYDKAVYQIMNALGKSASPTQREADYVSKWTNSLGFDMEVITEACERTVMATDNHRFEYADKILSSWAEAKVHHKSDIQSLDDAYNSRKKKTTSSSGTSTAPFKQFAQREYDYSKLEQEVLSN